MWEGDGTDVFTVGVPGELIPALLHTRAAEAKAFGTVLGETWPPLVVDRDVDFRTESGEAPGQLEGEAEDVGEASFQFGRPLEKRGDDTTENPLSLVLIRGVLSPGSSSLSIVDWRLGMLVAGSDDVDSCGCLESSITKLSSLWAVKYLNSPKLVCLSKGQSFSMVG